MREQLLSIGVACALFAGHGMPAVAAQSAPPKAASLSIVVIEGEDAVNIIQQKTAVAPVVEVRDRNNQPVAGAMVQFAIKGGHATFNGARTLTVATNAAGRAAVTGLTPTSSGAFQIGATAAFQGQTAAVTIAQVNVLTAAEAAGAAGAGATGGGTAAGGAAAGGAGAGGGIGASTIAVIGAAVAGGAVVATQVAGGDAGGSGGSKALTGSFSVPVTFTIALNGNTCNDDRTMSGTMTLTVDDPTAGTLTGTARANYTQTTVGGSCNRPAGGAAPFNLGSAPITGTPGNLTSTLNLTIGVSGGTSFDIMVVTGALANNVFTGAVAYRGGFDSAVQQNRGAVTFPVTLR